MIYMSHSESEVSKKWPYFSHFSPIFPWGFRRKHVCFKINVKFSSFCLKSVGAQNAEILTKIQVQLDNFCAVESCISQKSCSKWYMYILLLYFWFNCWILCINISFYSYSRDNYAGENMVSKRPVVEEILSIDNFDHLKLIVKEIFSLLKTAHFPNFFYWLPIWINFLLCFSPFNLSTAFEVFFPFLFISQNTFCWFPLFHSNFQLKKNNCDICLQPIVLEKMGAKFSAQRKRFFTRCLLFAFTMFAPVCKRDFFTKLLQFCCRM